MAALNASWLEDMAIRLLCVCALDHYGDFSTDQIKAPVRNYAAQTLGAGLSPFTCPNTRLPIGPQLQSAAYHPNCSCTWLVFAGISRPKS
jgi:hypothetical protein